MIRYSIVIKGIVQGVGFRPFVYRLAKSLSICGYVQNTSEGVYTEIEGENAACDEFITALKQHPPVLSQIRSIQVEKQPLCGCSDFTIKESCNTVKESCNTVKESYNTVKESCNTAKESCNTATESLYTGKDSFYTTAQNSNATAQNSDAVMKTLISPDIGICGACAADIAEKNNRRYRYAFTNCTDCGPRFTIIRDVPYDRKNTTMAEFDQCYDCRHEYEDPNNRRFHAQPNACPACGPKLCFYKAGKIQAGDPYELFDECIKEGGIIAVKGIGGYHLACDAKNEDAVARLRKNKFRYDKPFAVMMRDIDTIKHFCRVDQVEETTLTCPRKPIVLLKKKENCPIAKDTAPNNGRLGVMLPYTPLHCIIMQNHDVLVMTSANISGSPMIFDNYNRNNIDIRNDSKNVNNIDSRNDSKNVNNIVSRNDSKNETNNVIESMNKLFEMADAVLTHNRQIFRRMDDSVCMVVSGKVRMIRRVRGYVPEPVGLKENSSVILALGAQQKNTFCITKGENALLSGHIGDLDDMDTEKYYESEIQSYMRLFDAKPDIIVCDMHPDYISTRYANHFKGMLPIYEIQHHHAHFASVLAEHEVGENAIGLILDGTGYGEDGALWGGEALWGDIGTSQRIGHMQYAPLLGGEAAIREPWRMALAMLCISCGETTALEYFGNYSDKASLLLHANKHGINFPMTSGAGRLFDAVAALVGIRTHATFEGQAAIELEQAIDNSADGSYGFDIIQESDMMIFDWRQLICDIVYDAKRGLSRGKISAKFHRAMVQLLVDVSTLARKQYRGSTVVLSGGVFQNAYLLSNGLAKLEMCGFDVYSNEKVPANDGGISYGQAAAASRLIAKW